MRVSEGRAGENGLDLSVIVYFTCEYEMVNHGLCDAPKIFKSYNAEPF